MEDVLVMPPSITNDAEVSEDESEIISLDLHVSDTEDSILESGKKDTMLESEEDILNKFVEVEEADPSKDKLVNGFSESGSESEGTQKKKDRQLNGDDKVIADNCEETPKNNKNNEEINKENDEKLMNGDEPQNQETKDKTKLLNGEEENPDSEGGKLLKIKSEEIDEDDEEMRAEECEERTQSAQDKEDQSENEETSNKDGDEIVEESNVVTNGTEEVSKKQGEEESTKESEDNLMIGNEEKTINKRKRKRSEKSEPRHHKTVDSVEEESNLKESKDKLSNQENNDSEVKMKSTDIKVEKSDEEHQEDGDLLQVMETSFVDEADKDENSCSSMEKDENAKDEESEETPPKDNNAEITKDDAHGTDGSKESEDRGKEDDGLDTENNGEDQEIDDQDKEVDDQTKENDSAGDETQADNLEGSENDESHDVDTHECPMDIEENNIGGVIITEHDKSLDDQEEEEKESGDKSETASSIVEETPTVVNGSIDEDVVSLIDDDVVDEEAKKSTKRPLSEDAESRDDSKKIKLDLSAKSNTPRTLSSLKEYMREKAVKNLTRSQLEELCLQKICECLVDKSEVADLRHKVRFLEQAVENFRKEAVTVANQTRDLKIVHEKVTAALKVAKEQKGKHLVPVKITRSVGLQAVLEHPNRRHSLQNGVVQNGRTIPNNNLNNINTVNNNVTKTSFNVVNNNTINNNMNSNINNNINNNTPKSPPMKPQQQTTTKTPIQARTPIQINNKQCTLKENRTVPPPRAAPTQQSNNLPRKSTEPPKAVIDLTDEDEKTTTSSPTNRMNSRVNNNNIRVNGQTAKTSPTIVATSTSTPKLMVIPSSVLSSRPVMLKVNSNVVSQANGITIPTSQVSIVATTQAASPKTTQQVRIATTNVTSTNSTPPRKFRHPAPLPPPPPSQHQITTQRPIPPRPHLNLTKSPCGTGIVLQWKMPYQLDLYETIVSYQLYAYQETKNPPRTDSWGKIGDVKALELPMAVTLTQFAVGNRYFFAVRAVDVHKRLGAFSDPQTILL